MIALKNNKAVTVFHGITNKLSIFRGLEKVYPVYQPFAWILNRVLQSGYSLSWTQDNKSSDCYFANLNTTISLVATGTSNVSATVHSNSISTQKNKTIEISFGVDSSAGSIVDVVGNNSGRRSLGGAGTHLLDISKDDSIYLIVGISAWAKSANNTMLFYVKFY